MYTRPSLSSALEFMTLNNGKISLHLEIDKSTFWKLTKMAAEDEMHIEEWLEAYLPCVTEQESLDQKNKDEV